jgi:osmotically-inducible protein OsmY
VEDVSCLPAVHRRKLHHTRRIDSSLPRAARPENWPGRASDVSIERELKEALAWADPDLFSAVRVRVREGTVFLTGEVSEFALFRSLDELASVTPGVRYVKNGVVVVQEVVYEPPVWVE